MSDALPAPDASPTPSVTPKVVGGAGLVPTGITINRRLIQWDENGNPVPISQPVLAKKQIQDLGAAVMSMPYQDPLGLEPEFDGMTNAEVIYIRLARDAADGDHEARKELLDRVLGKPKQTSEVKKLDLTYQDFVDELARKAGKAADVEGENPLPPSGLGRGGMTVMDEGIFE